MNINRDQAFWAVILIGIGVLFLLANLFGAVFGSILRLWPLLLIAIGLYIIFGNTRGDTSKQERFQEVVGPAQSAQVKVNLSVGSSYVQAGKDPALLFDADVEYLGGMDYVVRGEVDKYIELKQPANTGWVWANPANWSNRLQGMRWDIGLTPDIPLDLDIHCGVGRARLDLSALQTSDLAVYCGLGETDLTLPAGGVPYPARINAGAGDIRIDIPEGAAVHLKIKGGMGGIRVRTAPGAAVRVTTSGGIGNVKVSPRYAHLQQSSAEFELRRSGVWETANFAASDRQIVIEYDGGIGTIDVD